jgi:exonuclease III
MKIMEWNIQQGGAARRREALLEVISKAEPDILALTEYQRKSDILLGDELEKAGYSRIFSTDAPVGMNTVAIYSRALCIPQTAAEVPDGLEHRWREMHIPSADFHLLVVHVPTADARLNTKRRFWNSLLSYGRSESNGRAMIIGDLNTGLPSDAQGTPFALGECMQELIDMGWTDLWREKHPDHQEFTWYSHAGNGFRIDHALATSEVVDLVTDVRFDHEARSSGASDHSALLVELNDLRPKARSLA